MTTPIVSSTAMPSIVANDGRNAPASRAHQTKTSFIAVHFYQPGKGRIIFLPYGAVLRVVGPSSYLPEGVEVMFDGQLYNIFETDLLAPKRAALLQLGSRSGHHYGQMHPMRH
jgi:hypothetical protein